MRGVLRQMLDRLTMSSGDRLRANLDDLVAQGDWNQALSVLQDALNEEPNNPKYKVEWADVLICKGEPDEARKILATIPETELEKQRPQTRLEIWEEAEGMLPIGKLNKLLDKEPDDLDCRYQLAIQLANQRDYEPSLDHLMYILRTDRGFREDLGRSSMVRVMSLMGKDSAVAKRYRRSMFNFMH